MTFQCFIFWRRLSESDRSSEFCRLVPYRLAKAPYINFLWSGKRGSNPRPLPWQGSALSTELFPHLLKLLYSKAINMIPKFTNIVKSFSKGFCKLVQNPFELTFYFLVFAFLEAAFFLAVVFLVLVAELFFSVSFFTSSASSGFHFSPGLGLFHEI